MPRRWRMGLALVWGATLGAAAAFWAAATLLAAGWVYLHGDDPWPQQFTSLTVPMVAALVGLSAFAAAAALWLGLPRISPSLDRRLGASAPLRWAILLLPMLLWAGSLWGLQRQQASWDAERAATEQAERRMAGAHRLTSAEWRLDGPAGQLRLDLTSEGTAGAYELRWVAFAAGVAEPLGSGAAAQALPAGRAAITGEIDAAALARIYAEAVLTRPESVQIDLAMQVELSLLPAGEGDGARSQEPQLRLTVPLAYDYGADGAVRFRAEGR